MRKTSPQQQSRAAINEAIEQDFTAYIVELSKAHLRSYPNDVYVLVGYARALSLLSRYEEAEAAFEQSLAHSDETWYALIQTSRGEMYQRRGDYAQAEACYLKAIEANPNNVAKHIFLATLTFRRGDLQLAEEQLRTALECEDDEEENCKDEAYLNLGGVLVAQERYREAAECYERAIQLDPDYELAKQRLRDLKMILSAPEDTYQST